MTDDNENITRLLSQWKQGDRSVEKPLAEFLYPMLHRMARAQARRNPGVLTLSPTELVNEVYERILPQQGVDWKNRAHFLAICATVLRRVVVDYIRERAAYKRGAGQHFVEIGALTEQDTPRVPDQTDWIAVDQALTQLESINPESARVLELRLFAGLTSDEIATSCGSSTATVSRQWRFARAWLAQQLDVTTIATLR